MVSLLCFVSEFRKPVVMESGKLTLDCLSVLKVYRSHGLYLDFIAFLPFNIVMPYSEMDRRVEFRANNLVPFFIMVFFRVIRVLAVSRI